MINQPIKRGECPRCGMDITDPDNFCYRCKKFVDQDMKRILEPGEISDETLDAFMDRTRKVKEEYAKNEIDKVFNRAKKQIIIGGIMLFSMILAIPGIILLAIGVMRILTYKDSPVECLKDEDIEEVVTGYLVPEILEEFFDEVEEYRHDKVFPATLIHESSLMQTAYNKVEGSDYVSGTYKGISVCFSDVELIYTYSKMADIESKKSVFKGMFLCCDLGITLPECVTVWERENHEDMGKGLATGNTAFDEQFYVESRHPETAGRIMTPKLLECIRNLDETGDGRTTLKFMEDGKLYVAIESKRDLFEIRTQDERVGELRRRFKQELFRILDLMEVIGEIKEKVFLLQ